MQLYPTSSIHNTSARVFVKLHCTQETSQFSPTVLWLHTCYGTALCFHDRALEVCDQANLNLCDPPEANWRLFFLLLQQRKIFLCHLRTCFIVRIDMSWVCPRRHCMSPTDLKYFGGFATHKHKVFCLCWAWHTCQSMLGVHVRWRRHMSISLSLYAICIFFVCYVIMDDGISWLFRNFCLAWCVCVSCVSR